MILIKKHIPKPRFSPRNICAEWAESCERKVTIMILTKKQGRKIRKTVLTECEVTKKSLYTIECGNGKTRASHNSESTQEACHVHNK